MRKPQKKWHHQCSAKPLFPHARFGLWIDFPVSTDRMFSFGTSPVEKQESQRLMGCRIQIARQAAGWTLEQLACFLAVSQEDVADLERGRRRVGADDLLRMVEAFGRDLEFFLDPLEAAAEAQFAWRTSAGPRVTGPALAHLEHRVGRWLGLLRWLRFCHSGRHHPLQCTLRLTERSTLEDVEARATEWADRLQLGEIPANSLWEKVERRLDISAFCADLTLPAGVGPAPSVVGLACRLPELTLVAVPQTAPASTRNQRLAHGVFHALTWDALPPPRSQRETAKSPPLRERMAERFAAVLLLPQRSLEMHWGQQPAEADQDARLNAVASRFGVSPALLAYRLETLGWVRRGRFEISADGPSLLPPDSSVPPPFSRVFLDLLQEGLEKGRISVRRAARILTGDPSPETLKPLFAAHGLPVPFDL